MTDTTETVTSDVRTCATCESPFGGQDDKRYKDCAACRGAVAEDAPAVAPAPVLDAPTMAEAGVKPIRLSVEKRKPVPIVAREYYWCGATLDSPCANITLGGISFPKTNGDVIRGIGDDKPKFVDHTKFGQVNHLTKATVDLCLEHAANKVIRNYRKEVIGNDPNADQATVFQGDIISMSGSRTRPFTPHERDIPIGCFIYMIQVRSRNDRPYDEDNLPPTMVERDW